MSNRISKSGFTLIELLVVLVLLGLAVGMTLVNLQGFSTKTRIDSALRQLADLDCLVRTRAICSGQPCRIVFREDGICFVQIPHPSPEGWDWAPDVQWQLGTGVRIGEIQCDTTEPEGPTVASDTNILVRADGTSISYQIQVESGVETGRIEINGITGKFHIE